MSRRGAATGAISKLNALNRAQEENERHRKALTAVSELKMEKLLTLSYIPRSKETWTSQFFYCLPKYGEEADPPKLGPEDLEAILLPREGLVPRVNVRHIKVLLILGDAHFLDEHINSHLVQCKAGVFLDIWPHKYEVRDSAGWQLGIGFVRVVNMSEKALTVSKLMAQEDLFRNILELQPAIIAINIGVTDMMIENISWEKNQVPKMYVDKIHELMCFLYTYLINSGFRGQFIESTTYTINYLPMYTASDSARQNKLPIDQTRRHSDNFGTNYCTYTRQQYKILSDSVNHKLHKSAEFLFSKFNCLLINPTPRWEFQGTHVDPRSGMPFKHQDMLKNFFNVMGRVVCQRRFCTLGPLSTRNNRRADEHLVQGCLKAYTDSA